MTGFHNFTNPIREIFAGNLLLLFCSLFYLVWWIASLKLELSVVAVLYGTGQFAPGRAAALAALVGIAFAASLICYVLYYRLDGMARSWDGMIPLIMAVFVMAVLLGALAVS